MLPLWNWGKGMLDLSWLLLTTTCKSIMILKQIYIYIWVWLGISNVYCGKYFFISILFESEKKFESWWHFMNIYIYMFILKLPKQNNVYDKSNKTYDKTQKDSSVPTPSPVEPHFNYGYCEFLGRLPMQFWQVSWTLDQSAAEPVPQVWAMQYSTLSTRDHLLIPLVLFTTTTLGQDTTVSHLH